MRKTSFDQIVDGIDRQLSYLHKERWKRGETCWVCPLRHAPAIVAQHNST